MLFQDYTDLAGPCKKGGRDDVREVAAMFMNVEDEIIVKSKKKKKAKKARK